ncbi:MAG: LysR substrate-binding domain-containing protein [Rhodocyclaceae bacterium]|nr:LysR substrate-binding domain-containing protein [Pseudomonadota bacterium]MDQ7972242.1 LysR substrate-binding domain-containing protein [Rhodocyclaceae bacterium]MDQ7999734.1 LysR substrate-binding domain-containing protein [Pseudomonadota bacterium]MDQ8018313.1 LysR substrate-binding domain-containing protein [Pseudomonadota bacterium]
MRRNQDLVDVHLLRVLTTLVTEHSVSRAAVRMNQTQPAISAALRRMRDAFGDPILVRERGGMVATPRARELRDAAREVLGQIDRMLAGPEDFTPATSTLTFSVATPDYLAASFMADVVARFRAEAPQARLVIHPLTAGYDYEEALAQGALDIVIGNWPQPPERMHLALLVEDDLVCLMNPRHPLAEPGAMTLSRYLAAAHVVPTPFAMSHRAVVDSHLAGLRQARDARVSVPYYGMAPYLVARSDLVFTTARHFAEQFTGALPVVSVPAPEGFPRMRFYQLWHERSQHQAAHRWLRGLLSAVGPQLAHRTAAQDAAVAPPAQVR